MRGCTASQVSGALVHERVSLREILDLGLQINTPAEQQNGAAASRLQGWRASWLPPENDDGPGVCVASYRYQIAGRLMIASFYYLHGPPAVAYPGNEEASRITAIADAETEQTPVGGPRQTNDEIAQRFVRHVFTQRLRDALRSSDLLDAYTDPNDGSVLVIRSIAPCDDEIPRALVRNRTLLASMQQCGFRRVDCRNGIPRSTPPTSAEVPPRRRGRGHH